MTPAVGIGAFLETLRVAKLVSSDINIEAATTWRTAMVALVPELAGEKVLSQLAADRTAGSVAMTDEERLEARRARAGATTRLTCEEILAWQAENYRRNRELDPALA